MKIFRLSAVFMMALFFTGTAVGQEAATPAKDNFFWTHRKERHWQSWAGAGPSLGLKAYELFQYSRYLPYSGTYFHGAENGIGGYSLAEVSSPLGLIFQYDFLYRANKWFGILFGLEYAPYYVRTKWYIYDQNIYNYQLDPSSLSQGPYSYGYQGQPPSHVQTFHQLIHGQSFHMQFHFQVPGGRAGFRFGPRITLYELPGVLNQYAQFPRSAGSRGYLNLSVVHSAFFEVRPRIRLEYQQVYWLYIEDALRSPGISSDPLRSSLLSLSIQYRLNKDKP